MTIPKIASYPMHTEFGEFTAYRFKEKNADDTHLALVKGNPQEGVSTVRVHSFQPLRDLFSVQMPNSGKSNWDIQNSLQEISQSERGVFVWIGHQQAIDMGEALDNFVAEKPTSPLQQQPYRSIGVGAQILRHLGVRDMRLLSSPLKFNALSGFDLNVVETIANPNG